MRVFPLLTVTALLATVGAHSAVATPGGGASARSALAQAHSEGARARERAAALDREARAATQASERATLAAAALGARLQQAEAELAGADAQLALLRGKRQWLARRLAAERAPITRLLAGLQTQVRRPPLLTLLQPGSIEDAVHLRAVVAAIGPQIAARTSGLRETLARSRALDDCARDNRSCSDREQEEGAEEHAVEAVPESGFRRRDGVRFIGVDAGQMRRHQRIPGLGIWRLDQSAGNSRSVYECEVDPPAEEEEGDGDERNRHRILHQGFQVIAPARHADLVCTEADVDQKHHDNRHPVVELGEDCR